MKIKLVSVAVGVLAMVSFFAGAVLAQPNFRPAEVQNPHRGINLSGRTVIVPETAVEVSPALYDLGTALDVDGRPVKGFAFIHYRQNDSHRSGHSVGLGKGGGAKCYSFLARGANWKTVEDYLVDSSNSEGLTDAFVRSAVADDIALWEDAADGIVDGGVIVNILGNETTGVVDGVDTLSPDGNNEVMFGDVGSTGAIAVTIVWGRFYGPPAQRELVEWDMVYDQVDFDWSADASLEPTKMDFDNIVQHELGHAVGLGHPDDSCTEETMYRFAAVGEVKKRTLEPGDIKGASELY